MTGGLYSGAGASGYGRKGGRKDGVGVRRDTSEDWRLDGGGWRVSTDTPWRIRKKGSVKHQQLFGIVNRGRHIVQWGRETPTLGVQMKTSTQMTSRSRRSEVTGTTWVDTQSTVNRTSTGDISKR